MKVATCLDLRLTPINADRAKVAGMLVRTAFGAPPPPLPPPPLAVTEQLAVATVLGFLSFTRSHRAAVVADCRRRGHLQSCPIQTTTRSVSTRARCGRPSDRTLRNPLPQA